MLLQLEVLDDLNQVRKHELSRRVRLPRSVGDRLRSLATPDIRAALFAAIAGPAPPVTGRGNVFLAFEFCVVHAQRAFKNLLLEEYAVFVFIHAIDDL